MPFRPGKFLELLQYGACRSWNGKPFRDLLSRVIHPFYLLRYATAWPGLAWFRSSSNFVPRSVFTAPPRGTTVATAHLVTPFFFSGRSVQNAQSGILLEGTYLALGVIAEQRSTW